MLLPTEKTPSPSVWSWNPPPGSCFTLSSFGRSFNNCNQTYRIVINEWRSQVSINLSKALLHSVIKILVPIMDLSHRLLVLWKLNTEVSHWVRKKNGPDLKVACSSCGNLCYLKSKGNHHQEALLGKFAERFEGPPRKSGRLSEYKREADLLKLQIIRSQALTSRKPGHWNSYNFQSKSPR